MSPLILLLHPRFLLQISHRSSNSVVFSTIPDGISTEVRQSRTDVQLPESRVPEPENLFPDSVLPETQLPEIAIPEPMVPELAQPIPEVEVPELVPPGILRPQNKRSNSQATGSSRKKEDSYASRLPNH